MTVDVKTSSRVDDSKRLFAWRDACGYFLGQFGLSTITNLVSMYMLIYYTQYLKIQPVHYTAIIMFVKIFDMVIDPYIGVIIDAAPPRGGKQEKFKPWIKFFAPILIVLTWLLFFDFSHVMYPFRVFLVVLTYLCWDLTYTFVNVPYSSLLSVTSPTQQDRVMLSSARSFGQFSALIPLQIILPFLLFKENYAGQSIFQGHKMFSIVVFTSLFALLLLGILQKTMEERIIHDDYDTTSSRADKFHQVREINRSFKLLFINRAFVGIALCTLIQTIFVAAAPQIHQLTYQIYYQNGSLNSLSVFPNTIPLIVGALGGPYLVNRFGTRKISAYPSLISALLFMIFALIPFPPNQPFWFILIQTTASTFGIGMTLYTWAMVSNCIDYQEWQTGDRREGSFYAVYAMIAKIGLGIGQALFPLILGAFVPGFSLANTATWTFTAANAIKQLSGWYPALGWLLSALCLIFIYDLSTDKMLIINKELRGNTG